MGLLLAVLAAVSGLGLIFLGVAWVGTQTLPPHFPAPTEESPPLEFDPIPDGLPAPVERHFRQVLPHGVPRIDRAVVHGRARFRLGPLWMPMRFEATYRPGVAFQRKMQITWFGRPIVRGVDSLLHGRGKLEISGRVERTEAGPKITQAQHLALWAEAVWTPGALLSPEVTWRPVDDRTAELLLPPVTEGEEPQRLTAHFTRAGLLDRLVGERYREQEPEPTPWQADLLSWEDFGGFQAPKTAATRWLDQASPYGVFTIRSVHWNLESTDRLE